MNQQNCPSCIAGTGRYGHTIDYIITQTVHAEVILYNDHQPVEDHHLHNTPYRGKENSVL